MSSFTLSETGNFEEEKEERVFRRLSSSEVVTVTASSERMWKTVKEKTGDDWIAYNYLGTQDFVDSVLEDGMWDDISEMPFQASSLHAPKSLYEPKD